MNCSGCIHSFQLSAEILQQVRSVKNPSFILCCTTVQPSSPAAHNLQMIGKTMQAALLLDF
jgi:hypothetical protein